jgi:hypothetical protein
LTLTSLIAYSHRTLKCDVTTFNLPYSSLSLIIPQLRDANF